MKKTIVASILGLAVCSAVNSSFGQGSLNFVNYSFTGSGNYSAPVTISGSGLTCGPSFTAQLLYSATGVAGSFSAIPGATSSFLGSSNGDTADGAGFFGLVGVTVPSYTSGNAYFEVQVTGSGFIGTSGVVVFSALATAANQHPAGSMLADNPDVVTPLTAFTVSPVPEPATLALAGLGGLASLVAFRRKQS